MTRNLSAEKSENSGGAFTAAAVTQIASVPSSERELKGHDIISYSGDFQNSDKVKWFEGLSDGRAPLSRCDTIAGVQMALKATNTIGPLAKIWANTDPELVLCFDAPDALSQEAWLVTTPTARAAPHVQAFIEFSVPLIATKAAETREETSA